MGTTWIENYIDNSDQQSFWLRQEYSTDVQQGVNGEKWIRVWSNIPK